MSAHRTNLPRALLLLGPTGSGKSPLGDWLQAHGLGARNCHHFDFGANLRSVVGNGPSERFSANEVQFLGRVLDEGVLLENESFHLAAKILTDFLARRRVASDDWLILNGLPRHIGQAHALAAVLHVDLVIQLICDAAIIGERLRRNTGGDRAGRVDDAGDLVARKLVTYRERTQPLIAFYQERGATLVELKVEVDTQPAALARQVEKSLR